MKELKELRELMEQPTMCRHHQIEAYLPVRCTILEAVGCGAQIEGKSQIVSPGGALLLMQSSLPLETRLLVGLGDGLDVQSRVVRTGQVFPTDLGVLRSHGIAFEQVLETSTLIHVLKGIRGQHHPRLPARIPVEYVHQDTSGTGTCLNLSQGGMFIGTTHPICAGQDLILYVKSRENRNSFTVPGRVVWTNPLESTNFFHVGMGVQFLTLGPTEQMHLCALLDKLWHRR